MLCYGYAIKNSNGLACISMKHDSWHGCSHFTLCSHNIIDEGGGDISVK